MEKHQSDIPKVQAKAEKEKKRIIREIGVLAKKILKEYKKNNKS